MRIATEADLLAVMAHRWLNMVAVIGGMATTLRDNGADLDPDDVRRMLATIVRQAGAFEDSLLDTVRAARPEVRAALQEMHRP